MTFTRLFLPYFDTLVPQRIGDTVIFELKARRSKLNCVGSIQKFLLFVHTPLYLAGGVLNV